MVFLVVYGVYFDVFRTLWLARPVLFKDSSTIHSTQTWIVQLGLYLCEFPECMTFMMNTSDFYCNTDLLVDIIFIQHCNKQLMIYYAAKMVYQQSAQFNGCQQQWNECHMSQLTMPA